MENIVSTKNELFKIAQKSDGIIYGAGEWAENTDAFLESHGIHTEAFCVSDDQEAKAKFATEKPVFHLSDLTAQKDKTVILAISEKWQDEVEAGLLARGFKNVFRLEPSFYYSKLEKDPYVSALRLKNSVLYNRTKGKEEGRETYETHFQELSSRYRKLILRQGFGRTIGGLLLELFFHLHYHEMDPECYYVYQPVNTEPSAERAYKEPNEEAIREYRGDNFEMIHRDTLGFWKYVLSEHGDQVEIDTQFQYDQDIMRPAITRIHEGNFRNNGVDYLIFDNWEQKNGEKELTRMGVEIPYGCVFARDKGYYRAAWDKRDEHIRTMESYRDSDFSKLQGAIRKFLQSGFQSVRVGKAPENPSDIPEVIDYAAKEHSDFMDIYLAHHSRFYFGDHSGVLLFQAFHDAPIAITNYPLITSYDDGTFPFVRERDLIIYHKFYDPALGRLLNLSELLEIEDCSEEEYAYSGSVRVFEKYKEKGIVPIENTPEELTALSEELIERINGSAKYSKEDLELRRRYWNILLAYVEKRKKVFWIDANVGRQFLRENLWLTQ